MIFYSIIMFLTAALTGGIGIAIYRGKTGLIHEYHQTRVTDKAAYGKAFGKALSVIAAGCMLSGIISLSGDSETAAMIAVSILFAGLLIGIALIIAVQKKYNNGIFGSHKNACASDNSARKSSGQN